MKQLLLMLLLIFTLQGRYIASEEIASTVPSAEQDKPWSNGWQILSLSVNSK